jgi:hypothetical protein
MTGGSPGGSVPQSLGDQTPFVMVPAFAEAASTSVAVKKQSFCHLSSITCSVKNRPWQQSPYMTTNREDNEARSLRRLIKHPV